MADLDDPVLRSIIAALNRSRMSTPQLAAATGIPVHELDALLHGDQPLTVIDAVRLGDVLSMSAKELFSLPRTIAVVPPERLAYSLHAFADAVCLSITTIRHAVAAGELVASLPTAAGKKPIITREEGLRWLKSLPSQL